MGEVKKYKVKLIIQKEKETRSSATFKQQISNSDNVVCVQKGQEEVEKFGFISRGEALLN